MKNQAICVICDTIQQATWDSFSGYSSVCCNGCTMVGTLEDY